MKKSRFVFCAVSSLATIFSFTPVHLHAESWRASAARAKITPESMMWMAGYAGRTSPAEGVASDLYAKAIVIEDARHKRVAICTLDLIGITREMHLEVARRLKAQEQLELDQFFLNASHTHCGPELRVARTAGTDEPLQRSQEAAAYTDRVVSTLVSLVGECAKSLKPAVMNYGQARCGFAMNRRSLDGKGGYSNFPNPEGPVDHQVPVLQVITEEGDSLAILFGYNCHATTLGFQQFCGDWPGFAQEIIEQSHPKTVAMFVNGCSGDQNPYPRRTLELAKIHGQTLATAVEAAIETKMVTLSGDIRCAYEEIPLAYAGAPTQEELIKRQQGGNKYETSYAGRLLTLLRERGSLPKDYPYQVQVIRLGDHLTFVALGGEVVVDYSLRLKRELEGTAVWVAGYSNDVMTYIPSLRVLKEGGYEAGGAMIYGSHPSPWSEGVEEHIVGTVKRLMGTTH